MTTKPTLLFLPHRIPYPPDKGEKIRAWQFLRGLSRDYSVYLGTFVDDPRDRQFVDVVADECVESRFVDLRPAVAKARALSALATGRSLTEVYYRNPALHRWVSGLAARVKLDRVLVYSSAMAQYAPRAAGRRVIDYVDVDSDKWRQYAASHRGPVRWIYGRESRRLAAYEQAIASEFDAGVFVSVAEAEFFRQRVPLVADRIVSIDNGVDADFFSPERPYDNPYDVDEEALVFTGAMDYWPNVDAVTFFAREVMPAVRKAHPGAVFYIVGGRPAASVKALEQLPGVRVTGRVPDVRPYVRHARAAVAPLRLARGVQNKVLEALAMAKPVLASPAALEGLDATNGRHLVVARDAAAFVDAVHAVLTKDMLDLGARGRELVKERYAWAASLERLKALLEGNSGSSSGQGRSDAGIASAAGGAV